MYVCVQLFPAVCRLLELDKLIIQINKSNQQMILIDYKEFQVLPMQLLNNIINATADVALS